MKKFKCVVTRTNEYIIELDENVLTEEYMKEFREVFYNFHDLEDHARHIAQFNARFDEESFIEGYGHVLRDGKLLFSFSDYEEDGSRKPDEKLRKPAEGINIITDCDDEDLEVEVEEIVE